MSFWDRITGNDMKRAWKAQNRRAEKLPPDYYEAWDAITKNLFMYSDFSGRNLVPIFENVLDFLEETSADGQSVEEVLGGDIKGFCEALADAKGAKTYHDKWRDQLNRNVAKKLDRLGEK